MNYLLLILEDDATIDLDEDVGHFEPPPKPFDRAECLKRLITAFVDDEKLGKFGVLEVSPVLEEVDGPKVRAGFQFSFKGEIE